jgi:acyl transferase domain-containing protein
MGGRFPGARGLEAFWQNLRAGAEAIEEFSEADLEAAGVPRALRADPRYVRRGTVLEEADAFDAAFFGFSPREAETLDPQQRVFLETAWAAMEHAGYAGDCAGRAVGVYAGAGVNTYAIRQLYPNAAFLALVGAYQVMVGNDKDFLATRVAYRLDLRGPALTIQTACSTSLVAVVTACRALQRGDCDMALAGGVAIPFPQRGGYLYEEGMILSPDGHCRPFDVAAKGIRPGAGAGVVVLKRLAEAQADGDTIHAVITGAALNNDGAAKAGYTAPSVEGQAEVIATAQALAGVDPRTIGYLETHGTGTPLGDPIELSALTQVFRAATPDVGFCRLGSLKANLGHLDAAAGVASLIKTVLAMEHRELPPLVHFQRANPQLGLETSPFVVPTAAEPWEAAGGPRRAGVSSFGIGGTNAHVVLEEAPPAPAPAAPAARSAQLLVLSARSEAALERATAELAAHLQAHPALRLADVAYTLQVGRKALPHRRALVARDPAQAAAALLRPRQAPVLSGVGSGSGRPVAFLFSGQGSQHVGMGRGLYEAEPVYREVVDRCARLLEPHLGLDLRALLFGPAGEKTLDETRLTQPALFVTEVALAALWAARGLTPSAMLGHSLGEYVAAHLAGVLSREDALAVVAARGRLMQAMAPGSMAAIQLAAAELAPLLAEHPGVELAARNAPGLCSVSGPTDAVARLVEQCAARGVGARPLHTSHGFHSASMEPALAPFRAVVAGVTLSPPRVPYVSNLTGAWITAEQATSPDYWAEHLRRAVRFEEGVHALAADPATLLLEVGPGNALATLARLSLGRDGGRAVASLAHPRERRPDDEAVLEAAGRLWLAGAPLDAARLHAGEAPRRVPLPTYPFERKRYWVEAAATPAPDGRARPGLPRRTDELADWFYAPTWARDDAARSGGRLEGTWLVLAHAGRFGEAVVRAVREAGGSPVLLEPAGEFQPLGEGRYRVRPGAEEDLRAVAGDVGAVRGVLFLWLVGPNPGEAIRVGYHSLVAAASALQPSPASPLLVLVGTEGGASVLDERVTQPQAAVATGPVITLPTEIPGLRMRAVDLQLTGRGATPETAAAELLAEAASPDVEPVVARRAGRRWVRRVDPVSLPPVEAAGLPLRDRGVYLVTGGLGGIGLTLAGWLARRCAARLLLTARTAMPPREEWDAWLARHPQGERSAAAIRAIREMEAAGGEVLVVAADAAAPVAMAGALAEAHRRWGRLDAVIHAAGISGSDRAALLKADSEVRGTFAPKVDGLAVLIELLGKQPLDFVALLSSASSLVGTPGWCDYAAANAVLDAFPASTSRPERWKRVLVVNYSAWRDVGMVARVQVPEERRRAWEAALQGGIPPEAGAETFARALASGRDQLAITPYDLVEVLARSRRLAAALPEEARPAGAVGPGEAAPAVEATQDRPALATPYEAPSTALERTLAAIWSELLGVQRVGVRDDWSQLGGHSLLATRMFSRIQQATGKNLPLAALLEGGTIKYLASLLGDGQAVAGPEPGAAAATQPGAGSSAATEPRQEPSFTRMVAIRRVGTLPPFFCVHGAGGNVLNFRDLARYMSRERPFFAFQARGLDGRARPHETIEDMAEEYLAELRTVQPHGPYFLSGYCGGGLVAYEMAQRLRAAGEPVAFLGLIELYRPGIRFKETRWRRWIRMLREEDWATLGEKIRGKLVRDLTFLATDLRVRLLTALGRTVPYELRDFWLIREYRNAAARYALRPFHGRLAVFRARDGMYDLLEDPGPDLGWGGLADEGIDARQVPGNHETAMRDPNVRELAEQMEDAIVKGGSAQLHRAG